MITVSQAVQKAKSYCDTYNMKYDNTVSVDVKQEGHMYTVNLISHGIILSILVDKETGGIINDIVF